MSAGRPARWLPLHMDSLPSELRALPWIGWRWHEGRKTPFQLAEPRRLAANNNPAHWRTEGDVREIRALAPGLFDGFGVVLTGGIVFVDLDDVRDPDTGAIAPWAMRMADTIGSWAEISVSGCGLHIFCRGRLPGSGLVGCLDGEPEHKVEVYDRGRFAYVTGHELEPVRPIADRQRLVTLLAQHVRSPGTETSRNADISGRDDSPIPEGQRNDQLFRIARGFVRHGLRGRTLEAALLAINARRCSPALPSAEVVKLARHAEQLPDRSSA